MLPTYNNFDNFYSMFDKFCNFSCLSDICSRTHVWSTHYICLYNVFLCIFFRDDASKKSENGKSLEILKIENTRLLRWRRKNPTVLSYVRSYFLLRIFAKFCQNLQPKFDSFSPIFAQSLCLKSEEN